MKRLSLLFGCAVLGAAAHAADYPSRPITLIVPLAAASTADILARALQPELGKVLGQTVVVENRPGAGGQIGMNHTAKQAPDGYTLVLGSNGTWAINVGLFKELAYDPVADFAPVTYLAGGSNVLVVAADSPFDSVEALVSAMRAAPGRLTYSSGGNGTTHHLSAELLNALTATSATHIPYRGAAQGVTAVMSGEVDFGMYNTPSVAPFVSQGKLRALASTGQQRSPLLPAIPTMMEAGVSDYVMSVDFGLLAPAGTPPQIVQTLNRAALDVMQDRAFRHRLEGYGFEVFQATTPTEFGRLIHADIEKWVPVVERAGAQTN